MKTKSLLMVIRHRIQPFFSLYYFIFFMVGLSMTLSVKAQTTYFVQAGATGITGTSWIDAFGSVQEAIDAASAGDQIWVAQGTHLPTVEFDADGSGSDSRELTFYINKNIEIYGGFQGTETSLSERNPDLYLTILSGDVGVFEDSDDNSYHVIFMDGSTGTSITQACVIDGFTIRDGNADQSGFPHSDGGAIFMNGENGVASPRINDCIFTENIGLFGGAISNLASSGGNASPLITNCLFESNSSFTGGAMNNFGDDGILNTVCINSVFIFNSAAQIGGVIGYDDGLAGSAPKFINCTFYENTAVIGGGVLGQNFWDNGMAPVKFTNCIAWANGSVYAPIGGSTTTFSYSLIDDGTQDGMITGTGITDGGNNLDSNPLFIDSEEGNLRLQQSSPALDKGTPDTTGLNLPAMDPDHYARLNDTIDMGVFENPHINCPDIISLDSRYSPLQGDYLAQSVIQVVDTVSIRVLESARFDAPLTKFLPGVLIDLSGTLNVSKTGCIPPP